MDDLERELSGLLLDLGNGRTVACSRLPDRIGGTVVAVEELRHNRGNEATFGIWRVRGLEGSAILKILRPPTGNWSDFWPTSEDPAHWNYWQREPLAYETGLVSSAYGECGLVPPELLTTNRRPDSMIELWLADVDGVEGFNWSASRIARFAYELGTGQARWIGRVPETEWLSRRWLAQYMAEGPSRGVCVQDADWDHPLAAVWPNEVRQELRRLWGERGYALAATEAAERTLCHLDVWPANLIDGQGRSVLLDWAFAGEGAVGEDVGSLILHCFTDGLMPAALLPEVAETSTDRYLEGLRDGGWSGSEDRVRSVVAASGVAKYSWFGPAVLSRAVNNDPGTSSYREDLSPASAVQRTAELVAFIAHWSRTVHG